MRKILLRVLAAAAFLSWTGALHAQGEVIVPSPDDRTSRVGTRGANFLHIGVGARPQALAGAAVGRLGDPVAAIALIEEAERISSAAGALRDAA
jgi:hypothetical protein